MFLVDYLAAQYLLILIPIILAFIAQAMVDSAYNRGNNVNTSTGRTGADIAR